MPRLLVVTAVRAEADAVLRGLPPAARVPLGPLTGWEADTDAGTVVVTTASLGPAFAAATAATALAVDRFDAVLSLGVAGGFDGRAGIRDVIVATADDAADLGVQTPTGFLTIADMGFGGGGGFAFHDPAHDRLAGRLAGAGHTVRTGTVLTVSTVTGTDERAEALATRYPQAVGEAMEGYGVVVATLPYDLPFFEVRTVSNRVGRRDHREWDLPGALDVLTRAVTTVFAEALTVP